MTMIQAVRDYIATCPLLKDGAILGIDQLDADPISYTIDTTPCQPIIKRYVDGGCLRQFAFVFAGREPYGTQVSENIQNSGFYERFADWIEQNNQNGIFPDLGAYRTPYQIEITSSGYAYDTDERTARYQIQLNLCYTQEWRYPKDE